MESSNKGIVWATLADSSVKKLQEVIKLPQGFNPPEHFHVTLYFGVFKAPYENLIGKKVKISISKYCYNENVIAIPADLTGTGLKSQNEVPHITWGLATGISPVESNKMLASAHFNETIPLTEVDLEVQFLEWKPK
ncbi:MAG: hypothetical protein AAGF07_01710 [Patescibacteria group bacterium]